jgi:hypothetical protein
MRRTILLLATMGTLLVMASGTALAQVTVTLSPEDATDLPVYSEHTVTATVRSSGDPLPGAEVKFSIKSGPDHSPSTYTAITGGDGQVPFTFTNSGRIGTDTIQADARGEIFTIPYSASNSTTATFTDTTLPTVEIVTPAKGLTKQLRSTSPTATFSEQMNPDSLTSSTVKLYRWNTMKKKWMRIRDVGVSCDSPCTTATLDPYPSDDAKRLAANTRHKVVISTVATDINANALAEPYACTFKTGRR